MIKLKVTGMMLESRSRVRDGHLLRHDNSGDIDWI